MSDVMLEQAKRLAAALPPPDKARLVEWLNATLSDEVTRRASSGRRQPLYGLCADLGPGPTDEDIAEVRREMWSGFPREDIA